MNWERRMNQSTGYGFVGSWWSYSSHSLSFLGRSRLTKQLFKEASTVDVPKEHSYQKPKTKMIGFKPILPNQEKS